MKCPKCGEDRYRNSGFEPCKRFKYLPLLPRIKRNYSIPYLAKLMQQHASDSPSPESPSGICDIWKKLYSTNGQYQGDSRAISFSLCTDGMNPFAKEKYSYSMWPITLSILNLPSYICTKFGSLLLFGIIPGSKEPKNIDTYLEVLIEEINNFPKNEILDSYSGDYFKPQASIVLNILDYPGQCKVFKCTGIVYFYTQA